jgi:hypothetical protein
MCSNAVALPVGTFTSFICSVLRGSSLEFSNLLSWLAIRFRPVLYSSIVVNIKLFTDLSSTIGLKDRGFVSVSSRANDWTVEMKAEDGSLKPLYLGSSSIEPLYLNIEQLIIIRLAMKWESVWLL